MQIKVVATDTFGGEANYSWVKEILISTPNKLSDRAIVRRAKAALGWSGVRCNREDLGNTIALWQRNACWVCFIDAV